MRSNAHAVEMDSEDTGEDPIQEINEKWITTVCTTTEHTLHESIWHNLSMIMYPDVEEHVLKRVDW